MKPAVELTDTARRHARAVGVLGLLENAALEPSLIRGDIVEIVTSAGTERFFVQRRRLRIAADGSRQLVIELDHPVRVGT